MAKCVQSMVRRLNIRIAMEDTNRTVCPRKFWTHTARPLSELAERLLQNGVIASANHDYENVYEWLECHLQGGTVELNISRKHHDGDIDEREPLAFLLIGKDVAAMDAMVDDIANQVKSALQMPITLGTIEYLGGDEYRYVPSES
jgi:hypothetical protein